MQRGVVKCHHTDRPWYGNRVVQWERWSKYWGLRVYTEKVWNGTSGTPIEHNISIEKFGHKCEFDQEVFGAVFLCYDCLWNMIRI